MCSPEQFDNKLLFYCFKAKLLASIVENRINTLVCSFKDLTANAETCSTEINLVQSSHKKIQEAFFFN